MINSEGNVIMSPNTFQLASSRDFNLIVQFFKKQALQRDTSRALSLNVLKNSFIVSRSSHLLRRHLLRREAHDDSNNFNLRQMRRLREVSFESDSLYFYTFLHFAVKDALCFYSFPLAFPCDASKVARLERVFAKAVFPILFVASSSC